MSKGLKIYACSGVGAGIGDTKYQFTYWKDNTNELTNTKAVNNMLSYINSVNADIIYSEHTEEELIDDCNVIDLYVTCLQAAKSYHGAELQRAGRVIGIMVQEGFFNSQSLDDVERDNNLDSIIDDFYKEMQSGNDYEISSPFVDWFDKNVVQYDYVGLSNEERVRLENAISDINQAVGATDEETAVDKFINSGGYYLYLYFNDEERKKQPYWIRKKIEKQLEVKTYTYGYYEQIKSTDALDADVYTGVCKTYGHTPDWMINNINNLQKKGVKGVGAYTELVITIIGAAVTVIAKILSELFTMLNNVLTAKYAVPTDANSGIATSSDLEALMQEEQSEKIKKYLAYGLIGGAFVYFIMKKL